MRIAEKILALNIGLLLFAPTSLAAWKNHEVTLEELKQVQPVYLEVTFETNPCTNDLALGSCTFEMTNTNDLPKSMKFKGDISITGGKMSLAKSILIGSDETLSNAENDLGVPTNKINFDFNTEIYKGLVLRVLFDESATPAQTGLTINVNGKTKVLSFSSPVQVGNFESYDNFAVKINILPYAINSSLEERNTNFKNKLLVADKLLLLESWARAQYLAGKMDAKTYNYFLEMSFNFWNKTFTDQDWNNFNWRYARHIYKAKKLKLEPIKVYAGVNVLLNYIK